MLVEAFQAALVTVLVMELDAGTLATILEVQLLLELVEQSGGVYPLAADFVEAVGDLLLLYIFAGVQFSTNSWNRSTSSATRGEKVLLLGGWGVSSWSW